MLSYTVKIFEENEYISLQKLTFSIHPYIPSHGSILGTFNTSVNKTSDTYFHVHPLQSLMSMWLRKAVSSGIYVQVRCLTACWTISPVKAKGTSPFPIDQVV